MASHRHASRQSHTQFLLDDSLIEVDSSASSTPAGAAARDGRTNSRFRLEEKPHAGNNAVGITESSSRAPLRATSQSRRFTHRVQGATGSHGVLTFNKQLYIDFGTRLKTFIRSVTIGLALAFALQQSANGFQYNTHFSTIYVTCLFVAASQSLLVICSALRQHISRHLLFMLELFFDFFSCTMASLIGAFANARCESDTPVKPCYQMIMRAPVLGCALIGTTSFLVFLLTLLRK